MKLTEKTHRIGVQYEIPKYLQKINNEATMSMSSCFDFC